MQQAPQGKVERTQTIENLLYSDTGYMGKVYRAVKDGLTVQQIAKLTPKGTPSSAEKFIHAIRILLGDEPYDTPNKNDAHSQAYYKARKWVELPGLNDTEKKRLRGITNHVGAVRELKRKHPEAPGIYVYTYPIYLSNPIDNETGKTLFKIGRSDNVPERLESQRRTEYPEDLKVIRVYPTNNAVKVEKQVQGVLRALGRHHSTSGSGTEWYLTNPQELDEMVGLLIATA